MARWLRKFPADTDWQRGFDAISTGCLWRSDEFALSRAAGGDRNRGDRLEVTGRVDEISRIALAGTGRRDLGSAWRTQTFHAFENDGIAGISSRCAVDRESRDAGERTSRALETNSRSNPSGSLRTRLQLEGES